MRSLFYVTYSTVLFHFVLHYSSWRVMGGRDSVCIRCNSPCLYFSTRQCHAEIQARVHLQAHRSRQLFWGLARFYLQCSCHGMRLRLIVTNIAYVIIVCSGSCCWRHRIASVLWMLPMDFYCGWLTSDANIVRRHLLTFFVCTSYMTHLYHLFLFVESNKHRINVQTEKGHWKHCKKTWGETCQT